MKKTFYLFATVALTVVLAGCHKACMSNDPAQSGFPELDAWAKQAYENKTLVFGYPCNQNIELDAFYKWYNANHLESVSLNNVGDPFSEPPGLPNTLKYEREVIEFFAPYYGFTTDEVWGLVSNSGTDGNNHGIYFGANYLRNQTGQEPVMYVSDEAHYSNMRLANLQGLDLRLIKSDEMGRMIPEDLEQQLDPNRPCLIVYAMGSTFKGAIDDMQALNAVLAKYPDMPVFRHVDAALFGGYLPFTEYKDMVDCKKMNFQSIAISAHKFFGSDDPAGLLLTTKDVYNHQDNYDIPYLNKNMKMINCSRSAISSLKFWWLIQKVGVERWQAQAAQMLECTNYLDQKLTEIGYPHWVNEYSNTIVMKRPAEDIVKKYVLACSDVEAWGGPVSHIVVMQHVTHEAIDGFIKDLQQSIQ